MTAAAPNGHHVNARGFDLLGCQRDDAVLGAFALRLPFGVSVTVAFRPMLSAASVTGSL